MLRVQPFQGNDPIEREPGVGRFRDQPRAMVRNPFGVNHAERSVLEFPCRNMVGPTRHLRKLFP